MSNDTYDGKQFKASIDDQNEINRSASTNSEAIFGDRGEIKNDLAWKHSFIFIVTLYQ
jgi:hypothetical protein